MGPITAETTVMNSSVNQKEMGTPLARATSLLVKVAISVFPSKFFKTTFVKHL